MDDDHGVRLDANTKAHRAMNKAAAISWPLPADRRLDQLVSLANDAGAATHRNELTAAMVAAATPDGDHLLGLVVSWRRLAVRDVVIDVEPDAQVIYLPRYRPGRRRRDAG